MSYRHKNRLKKNHYPELFSHRSLESSNGRLVSEGRHPAFEPRDKVVGMAKYLFVFKTSLKDIVLLIMQLRLCLDSADEVLRDFMNLH